MKSLKSLAATALVALAALGGYAYSEGWIGTPNTSEYVAADQTGDYFHVSGSAQREYQTTPGNTGYCEPDELGRARCAFGELTADTRTAAKDRGRQSISVNPAGWGHNAEVTIPALSDVAGSTEYHGWMFNRSHLLADSLGGTPTANNLVTGTRGQNVGSTGNTGGMAYAEVKARDYLDGKTGTDAASCPLYYAATPQYTGTELLPRTVTVDMQSCDNSIDERVVVDNTANGFNIDYATGAFTPSA